MTGKCGVHGCHGNPKAPGARNGLCPKCSQTMARGVDHPAVVADRDALTVQVGQLTQQLAEAEAPRLLLPDAKRCTKVPEHPDGIMVGPDGRCIHRRSSGERCVFHQ